jgi:hypothetical protein
MSRGKYYSLEEARKDNNLEQFCKEHPSDGNKDVFNNLFQAMANGTPRNLPVKQETSTQEPSEDCSETQTHRGI